ncbi:GNAT family N-acetyltransferase [Caldalkalibacillus salinus]|uniref:GNAT family N-acetyltransferase n=1 Tax=Caldalkalibacillus salinus TaxID=2803787 RepID=UPI0019210F85|nr:GNAT family N-acetyltransferase [Caldalkalibacillus salinus]
MGNDTFDVKHVQTDQQQQDAFHVRHEVFVQEQQVPAELEVDEHEDNSEHVVAYDQTHQPVGAGRLRPISNTAGKVERVSVMKRLRGEGLGFQIMKKIEEVAQKKGLTELILHAQAHAEDFYLRLGYETVSEPFEEAGIEHVKMKKEL